MKLLIDERLHTSLLTVAHDAGHVCEHDWQLMSKVCAEEYTFVTNNRADFTVLFSHEELHAGLIILIPNVTPLRQRELFKAALSHIAGRDLTNAVLEMDVVGTTIVCREYSHPS